MNKLKIITNTLFAFSCACLISSKSMAEPMNLQTLKNQLAQYQASGEYERDIASVAHQADEYITQTVQANNASASPAKLALVLDIDETSLSNLQNIVALDFCNDSVKIDQAIAMGNDPAITPVLNVYQHAIKQGVAVFFVTGRREAFAKSTSANLKSAGFNTWSGLYFRPKNDTNASVIPFKTQARHAITASGYRIIASIGDQESDLTGSDVNQAFKLPNPYYYLP